MMAVVVPALRGALGFGLGGLILFMALGLCVPRATMPKETPSFVGRWWGAKSPDPAAVGSAEFKEDGTVLIQIAGGSQPERGTYTLTDANNARLNATSFWTHATVNERQELHLRNDAGTRAQRLGPVSPASQWLARLLLPLLAAISAVVGATILFRGTRKAVRASIGFAVGAWPGALLVLFTLISLQGGGQTSSSWGAVGCGLGFGLAGAIGALAVRPGLLLPGGLAFGAAGAVGGHVLFLMVGRQVAVPMAMLTLLLPFVLGGGLFGAATGLLGVEDPA